MNKTDRELLKDALELKVQIRNLSSEEQKEILLNKISEIRECIKKISLAFEKYELSSRQKEVESLALIEDKDIADTYWEYMILLMIMVIQKTEECILKK